MTQSKWLKWKIIHKETGLTFNQYVNKFKTVKNKDLNDINTTDTWSNQPTFKCVPVILESGIPAMVRIRLFSDYGFESFDFQILNPKDWIIEQKTTKEIERLITEEL